MKKSDLTAYLDGELDSQTLTEVEAELAEREELLEALAAYGKLKLLTAELCEDNSQTAPAADTASVNEVNPVNPVTPPDPTAEDPADPAAPAEPAAEVVPTEPPPVDVERPRRVRSGPAHLVLALAAAAAAMTALALIEIGGWTRSSRAVVTAGQVIRHGTPAEVTAPRMLYFDDVLSTRESAVSIAYSDTDVQLQLAPWSRARFSAHLNTRQVSLLEGTLKVTIEEPPAPPKKPDPSTLPKPTLLELVLDELEPWVNSRRARNESMLVIDSAAGRLEIPEKRGGKTVFDLSVVGTTMELKSTAGSVDLYPLEGERYRFGGRRHLRTWGTGEVKSIGRVAERARVTLRDAATDAPLPGCAPIRPNETVGLIFAERRPISVEFTLNQKVASVRFYLFFKPLGSDTFSELSADQFRPKGKVSQDKPPFFFFGENAGKAVGWKPHRPGVYKLQVVPILPKQQKPNYKAATEILLDYR